MAVTQKIADQEYRRYIRPHPTEDAFDTGKLLTREEDRAEFDKRRRIEKINNWRFRQGHPPTSPQVETWPEQHPLPLDLTPGGINHLLPGETIALATERINNNKHLAAGRHASGFERSPPPTLPGDADLVAAEEPWAVCTGVGNPPFPPTASGDANLIRPGTFIKDTHGVLNRTFASGANRNPDTGKLDYEGFLSPRVLKRFAQYMDKHRTLADGSRRESDNWQKGIPIEVYAKSKFRHDFDVWCWRRGVAIDEPIEDALCASLFNTMGLLLEVMKAQDRPGRLVENVDTVAKSLEARWVTMHPALGAAYKTNVDTVLTPPPVPVLTAGQEAKRAGGFLDF